MENLQSETDNTMEEDKKRHEEEYKWEMEDYEKRMYEEEVRRQVRKEAWQQIWLKRIEIRINRKKLDDELRLGVDGRTLTSKVKV